MRFKFLLTLCVLSIALKGFAVTSKAAYAFAKDLAVKNNVVFQFTDSRWYSKTTAHIVPTRGSETPKVADAFTALSNNQGIHTTAIAPDGSEVQLQISASDFKGNIRNDLVQQVIDGASSFVVPPTAVSLGLKTSSVGPAAALAVNDDGTLSIVTPQSTHPNEATKLFTNAFANKAFYSEVQLVTQTGQPLTMPQSPLGSPNKQTQSVQFP